MIGLEVLLLDEVSMLDVDIWESMTKILGLADHARHGFRSESDEYGSTHLILFGAPFSLIRRRFLGALCGRWVAAPW